MANSALGDLNPFLKGQDCVAGSQLTVADITILVAISTIEIVPFDLEKFPNIVRWYKNAPKDTPGWNEKVDSLKQAKKFLEEKLAERKES